MNNQLLYPLTFSQQSIWDIETFYKNTSYGNLGVGVILRDDINIDMLEKAVNIILQEHEAIRLRFIMVDGEPRQYVAVFKEYRLNRLDFSHQHGLEEFELWKDQQTRIPFNLLENDLFYIASVRLTNFKVAIYFKFHHLISDAWSLTMIIKEVLNAYKRLMNCEPFIPEQKPSYLSYILEDIDYYNSPKFMERKVFWQQVFQANSEFTSEDKIHGRKDSRAKRMTFTMAHDLSEAVKLFSNKHNVSEFIVFFAVFALYLSKAKGKQDLVIGTPVLNRANFQQRNTAGMFISNVPFPITIDFQWDFLTFINHISKVWKKILKNQRYPYKEILRDLRVKQGFSGAINDVAFSYQISKLDVEGIDLEPFWSFNGHEINTLSLSISDWKDDGELRLDYDYLIKALSDKDIERIHSYLITFLKELINEPTIPLSKISLLTSQEKYELIHGLNLTSLDYPKEKTIHQLFEEQVKKTPEQIALVVNGHKLTYIELNGRANQIAKRLRLKGLTPDSIVGIMMNRSPELMISILAVLKAGGAYLPIDPLYPLARIEEMLCNSRAHLLLTNPVSIEEKELFDMFSKNLELEILDLKDSSLYTVSKSDLINFIRPNNLAYVIYTSGSTGAPKGVMIEHRSVNNLIHALWKFFYFSEKKVIVSLTTVAFDIFVMETLVPLSYGLTLVIANEVEQKSPALLFDLIKKNDIEMLQATPSKIQSLLKDPQCSEGLAPIMDMFIGGEPLTETVLHKLQNVAPAARIYNMYGPTETTVWSMYKELTSETQITLGKPIANTQIYILDQGKQIVPQGVTGEIYIGGEGLARGYLYRNDLTQERFIPNPFHEGQIIYKTGDLGRWTTEGEIEYLGRNDDQVKIRGFRIELDEIRKVLVEHVDVQEAVVISHVDGKKRNYLCAYLVGDKDCSVLDIRTFLEQRLPEYMIPAKFLWLDAIPLTLNLKVDKRSLPAPTAVIQDTKLAPPENLFEEELVRLWTKVLDVEQVGVEDNFFLLGGDSLAIIEILTEVWSKKWDLKAQDFYDYPTVRQLSDKVRGKLKGQKVVDSRKDFPRPPLHYELQGMPDSKPEWQGNVLLTGATGFLGIHLLWELLNSTSGLIYCLMRGSDLEKRFQRLFDSYFPGRIQAYSQRIKIIKGDISQKHFKMTPEGYSELGKNVHSVIHAAGLVKHYGEYSDFEKINVQGTQEVIDFCITFSRPLQHISTISIAGNRLTGDYTNGHFDEVQLYIGQNYLDNLYIRSKFEAEVRVLEASRLGLHAAIFRVGILTGRYSDGHFQENIQENAFYQKLKSFLEIKAISQDMLNQELEFTPVDACAQGIVDIIRTNTQPSRVFHMFNHKKLKMTKLIEILYLLGIKVQILDTKSFYQLIDSYVQSPHSLSGFVLDLTEDQGIAESIAVESTITQAYLAQIGFQWPEITEGYLTKLIKYMVSVGFLLQII
ncbi:non-ribosomal peptide synthetase [Desulfosporosinus meridiei]|uniref:Amino acid adenylation enzyme/thioester reductase family protein n=1 Tax=Desulfosporosinus meridiei (strain ATCC BAA-275 / DSM 13257 / KCTC 12902 / NCIMB 13706 / S10) TaxID=768704 RepID=J7J4E9_DESMD|nr:non-ribosomal peptide synthetase [Desulfosporosinus meridiei]AFQ46158.1 amino acid adenylation enzyme/thioester reductase family protein [Desulfosporosinus meridiei DSM 13257]